MIDTRYSAADEGRDIDGIPALCAPGIGKKCFDAVSCSASESYSEHTVSKKKMNLRISKEQTLKATRPTITPNASPLRDCILVRCRVLAGCSVVCSLPVDPECVRSVAGDTDDDMIGRPVPFTLSRAAVNGLSSLPQSNHSVKP